MLKKFEINLTKTKGGCQSARKVVTHKSKSDLPLDIYPWLSPSTHSPKGSHFTASGKIPGEIVKPARDNKIYGKMSGLARDGTALIKGSEKQ